MASKTDTKDAAEETGKKKGSPLKLVLLVLPTVLLIAVVVYFLVFAGKAGASTAGATPTHTPVPGPVVAIDPITINLAGGHYLKLGMGLQPDTSVGSGETVTGEKALDLAIGLFSGKSIDDLSSTKGREEAKAKLTEAVAKAYDEEVYKVYFTEFVMQ